MPIDNNTIEVVRAINRNTDELRRITAELKKQNAPLKIRVASDIHAATQRLQEPLSAMQRTFSGDDGSIFLHTSDIQRITEPAKDVTTLDAQPEDEDG